MYASRVLRGFLFAVVLTLSVSLAAQSRPGSGSTGSGSTGTGSGSTGTTGTTNVGRTTIPSTQPQQQQPQFQRPIFISGAVVMADGSPVPRNVEIMRVCSGRSRREGYTDSTGHFGFQVGQNTGIQDASTDDFGDSRIPGLSRTPTGLPSMASSGLGAETSLMGCELRAQFSGMRSSSIDLSTFRAFDNPDVGTIVLERLEKVPGTMTSATTMAAPKDASKAFKKALEAIHKGKTDEAVAQLQKATSIYPKYAEAWLELGLAYQRQGDNEAARRAYEQALNADSKFVGPYIQLAVLAAMKEQWQESAKLSDQAIQLDPIDYASSYFYNSVANFNLGHFDVAESTARKALKMDQQHRMPQIQLLLGRILMVKKDYPGAVENLRGYLQRAPDSANAPEVRRQLETLQQAAAQAQPPAAAAAPAPKQ